MVKIIYGDVENDVTTAANWSNINEKDSKPQTSQTRIIVYRSAVPLKTTVEHWKKKTDEISFALFCTGCVCQIVYE